MDDKRARLAKLLSIRGVTDSALCKILKQLQGQEVPEASLYDCRQAARSEYDEAMALQLKLPLLAGGVFDWDICRPSAFVQRCVQRSAAMRRLFARQRSTPATPWHIVLAHDEVTPGAVLRPHNKRKFLSFYMSFLQFGHAALRSEACWFPIGIIRSSVLDKVDGGVSCALRLMLRAMLLQDGGNFVEGVVLDLDDGPTLFFAQFRVHLGDEAALSRGLSCKGASGMRPCIKCANVLKKGSNITTPGVVEIDCFDEEKIVANTNAEVWRQFDLLLASDGVVSKAELERRQKAAGLTIARQGLLADAQLRPLVGPLSSHRYDWMHTYLSNGVCSVEIYLFMEACKANGFKDVYPKLEEYCKASWCFPHQHAQAGMRAHAIFCKQREAASKEHWRSSASELLTVYPLLRHFAEQVVSVAFPGLQQHVTSLSLSFRVIDALQDIKGGTIDVPRLRKAIFEHLQKHSSVYGQTHLVPKHHFAIHLPQQVAEDGALTDTFVVERSHLLPRDIADEIDNSIGFERSAIQRVILARLVSLESWDERPGLTGKDAAISPELSQALGHDAVVAAGARLDGIQLQRGDFLQVAGYNLCLSAVCKSGDNYFLVCSLFDSMRSLSSSSSLWSKRDSLHMLEWTGQRIRQCHSWSLRGDGAWLVLHSDLQR